MQDTVRSAATGSRVQQQVFYPTAAANPVLSSAVTSAITHAVAQALGGVGALPPTGPGVAFGDHVHEPKRQKH